MRHFTAPASERRKAPASLSIARQMDAAAAALARAVLAERLLQARASGLLGALGKPTAGGAAHGARVAVKALRTRAFTTLEARAVVTARRRRRRARRSELVGRRRFDGLGRSGRARGGLCVGSRPAASTAAHASESREHERRCAEDPERVEREKGAQTRHLSEAYTLVRERARREE